MSLFIASLNSGSNGNCYYIGNGKEAVLVDVGISCRETEARMRRLQLPVQHVKAVFISHEHTDHIQGLPQFIKKYKLPVYITENTFLRCGNFLQHKPFSVFFKPYEPVTIGNLRVTAFPKLHDATEPHSFIVADHEITVGVLTDIGSPCSHVIHHFKQCHAAFLEANYDDAMLAQGNYPIHLKKRISGRYGHLSNQQALDLFLKHKPPFMSHLLLSHLSKENNHPQLVENLFNAHAGNTNIIVASRFRETDVYEVKKTNQNIRQQRYISETLASLQLSLF